MKTSWLCINHSIKNWSESIRTQEIKRSKKRCHHIHIWLVQTDTLSSLALWDLLQCAIAAWIGLSTSELEPMPLFKASTFKLDVEHLGFERCLMAPENDLRCLPLCSSLYLICPNGATFLMCSFFVFETSVAECWLMLVQPEDLVKRDLM